MRKIIHLPRHVAITMDGNRRWAKKYGLSTKKGHEAGARRIEPLVDFAARLGIKCLTFYAFSSENFSREKEEKQSIFEVFDMMLHDPVVDRMMRNKVRVQVIGDMSKFPRTIRMAVEHMIKKSAANDMITVNFALNYGGRGELVRAVKKIITEGVAADNVDEAMITSHLYTAGLPDPDIIIRPGGEQRLSNFLPWQSVYSELYFSEVLWPNFTPEEFKKALAWYSERAAKRRFGK